MTFSRCGPTLSQSYLHECESHMHVILPQAYREFMLVYNGGVPDGGYLKTSDGERYISVLYSLAEVQRQSELFHDVLPSYIIPIGNDGAGNPICLATDGPNNGRVYLWDGEWSVPASEKGMEMLSSDFGTLLESLYRKEVPESKFNSLAIHGTSADMDAYLSSVEDANILDHYGHTLVQEIAKYGKIELLNVCYEHGMTLIGAIHCAAHNNQYETIKWLLDHGVDPDEKDENGQTALCIIRPLPVSKRKDIDAILKERGATAPKWDEHAKKWVI